MNDKYVSAAYHFKVYYMVYKLMGKYYFKILIIKNSNAKFN